MTCVFIPTGTLKKEKPVLFYIKENILGFKLHCIYIKYI